MLPMLPNNNETNRNEVNSARNEFYSKFHQLTSNIDDVNISTTQSPPATSPIQNLNNTDYHEALHLSSSTSSSFINSEYRKTTRSSTTSSLIPDDAEYRKVIRNLKPKKRKSSSLDQINNRVSNNDSSRRDSLEIGAAITIQNHRRPHLKLENCFTQQELVQSPTCYLNTPSATTPTLGYFHPRESSTNREFSQKLDISNEDRERPNIASSHDQSVSWDQQLAIRNDMDAYGRPTSTGTSKTTAQNCAYWEGDLHRGKNEKHVASVILEPLNERHIDSELFKSLDQLTRIKIQSVLPFNYVLELIKRDQENITNNQLLYPLSTLRAVNNADAEKLDCTSKVLKWSEYVGIMWLSTKTALYFCPTSNRTCEVLRIRRPCHVFILFQLPLERFPMAPILKSIEINQTNSTVQDICSKDLRSLGMSSAAIMSRLINFPDELRAALSNSTFTVIGNQYLMYFESADMIAFMKAIGGRYKDSMSLRDPDLEQLTVVLVHRTYLQQLNISPKIAILKQRRDIRFYIFGIDIANNRIPFPYPKEIYPLGGILTVTSAGLLCQDGVLDELLRFIRVQQSQHRPVTWIFKIHQDIYRFMKECAENSKDPQIRRRAHDVWMKFHKYLSTGRIEYMLPIEVHEPLFDQTNDEILHWSMQRMSALYYAKYRHFVLIDIRKNTKFQLAGVEIMEFEEFQRSF